MKPISFHRIFFSLLFLFIILQLSSQSLYEIKFSDKQKIQYSGFLVFFHETNAYMRIAYTNENVYNVVNVTYTMSNGVNSQGDKYSMLTGSNPIFITSKSTNRKYNPDYFIWFYDYTDKKWGQPYTTDDSLLNPDNYITVDSYLKLDPKTLTDEYLRRYFGNYESEYFSMKKMCGLTPEETNPVSTYKSSQLHFVLVANTLDPSIGTSCTVDETNLRNEFRQVSDALGTTFREYVVDGYSLSREKVLATLNALSPGSNDIVVFVYRGHGFRWKDQNDDWPRMDLRTSTYSAINDNSSMNLSEVYHSLNSKGARLNIILGDCCNSEINRSPVTGNNYLTFQVDNNSDLSKLRKLFMNSKGTILSAAAQKGEVSWASPQGGLYSISFLQALREEISYLSSGSSSWENVIAKTISMARLKSTTQFCSNCTLQNGIKYVSVINY
jgi:hypothetical protein